MASCWFQQYFGCNNTVSVGGTTLDRGQRASPWSPELAHWILQLRLGALGPSVVADPPKARLPADQFPNVSSQGSVLLH